MEKDKMFSTVVPTLNWFDYQAWLMQNYMFPMRDFYFYPLNWTDTEILFVDQEHQTRFVERWEHTFVRG
jgi:hypothetical protein